MSPGCSAFLPRVAHQGALVLLAIAGLSVSLGTARGGVTPSGALGRQVSLGEGLLARGAGLGIGTPAGATEPGGRPTVLGPGAPAPDPDRWKVMVGGQPRQALVRRSRPVAAGARPQALLLVLHGGGGSGEAVERSTGFTPWLAQTPVVVVYPDGTGRELGRVALRQGKTWNAVHCCGTAMQTRVDDVAFLRRLIDSVATHFGVPEAPVFVTGISNGAMMAHTLAAAWPTRIRAIAPVMGSVFVDFVAPAPGVSLLAINGLADTRVRPEGGLGPSAARGAWDGVPLAPIQAQGTRWAAAAGCQALPRDDRGPSSSSSAPPRAHSSVRVTQFACHPGRRVALVALAGHPHAWPGSRGAGERGLTRLLMRRAARGEGSGTPQADGAGPGSAAGAARYDATAEIWTFFTTLGAPPRVVPRE